MQTFIRRPMSLHDIPQGGSQNGTETLHPRSRYDRTRDILHLGLAGHIPAQLAHIHSRRYSDSLHVDLRQGAQQRERMIPICLRCGTASLAETAAVLPLSVPENT